MCVFFFPCWYAVPTTGFTREAQIEFGDEVVSRLKLSPDGFFGCNLQMIQRLSERSSAPSTYMVVLTADFSVV